MSFSFDTKTELCRIEPERDCCVKAECYGMLLFARSFSRSGIALVTENRAVAHRAAELTVRTSGVIADVSAALTRRRNSSYTLTVQTEHQRDEILRRFGYTGREISLRINRSNLENECCHAAFVRGAFLSCGTVTDPHKDYHLEFNVPFMNLAKDFMALLSEDETLNLQPALINRKGAFVVYVKGSEHIADLLAYLGAGSAAMELMQVRMLKEVRNNVNRKTNFETANIDKTVSASVRQMKAIRRIETSIGLKALPDELRETAELRYQNPEMSLRELGRMLSEPISRSGVNHRLSRILKIAENLKEP